MTAEMPIAAKSDDNRLADILQTPSDTLSQDWRKLFPICLPSSPIFNDSRCLIGGLGPEQARQEVKHRVDAQRDATASDDGPGIDDACLACGDFGVFDAQPRSEEHTSELQSRQ